MTLETVWFCLIAVLWSGYFLLEGFDFGVGMLLPFLPRAGSERERAVMFESIGPVWDGNEVWLVVAGGRHVRRVPGVVRDDVLGLLHRAAADPRAADRPRGLIRVAREERGPALAGRLDVGEHDRQRRRVVHLGRSAGQPPARRAAHLLTPVRGRLPRPVQRLHRARRPRPSCACSRCTERPTSRCAPPATCASERAATRTAARPCSPPSSASRSSPGRSSSPTIATSGASLPAPIPAALAALGLAPGRLAHPHAPRAAGRLRRPRCGAIGIVATIFTGLYPRVIVSHRRFANSLTISNAAAGALRARGDHGRRGDLHARSSLLYQGWTYHVFRKRLRRRAGRPARSRRSATAATAAPARFVRALDPRLLRRTRSARPLLAARRRARRLHGAGGPAPGQPARADRRAGVSTAPRLHRLWLDIGLLLVAFAAREAHCAWGMEIGRTPGRLERAVRAAAGAGREAAAQRSRPRSTAPTAPRSRPSPCRAIEALEGYFARYLPQVVLASIVPLLVVAWVAFVDLESALIMLLTLPLVPVFMWLIGRYTEQRTRARWQALRRLSTHFLDVVRGLPTLRAFGRAARSGGRASAEVSERYRADDDGDAAGQLPVGLGAGARGDARGGAGRGDARACAWSNGGLGAPGRADRARARARAVPAVPPARRRVPRERGRAGGGRADVRAARRAGRGRRRRGSRLAPSPARAPVRLEQVSFSYPARAGARARRARPRAGARRDGRAGRRERRGKEHGRGAAARPARARRPGGSRVGGVDLAACDPDAWRRLVAWVPQHPTLFRGTVADNIRLGDPDASERAVRDAAALAGRGRVRPRAAATATTRWSATADGRCRPASAGGSGSRAPSCGTRRS